jgi:carboxypeptidase T
MEEHDFALGLSYHSYGNLFLFPWGYIDEDTEDNAVFERLGRIYCRQNGYIYGNAKDGIIYNTNGDMDDWAYGEQETKNKILSMTVEVGDSFQPPSSEIPKLIGENLEPVLRLIFAAGRL